MTRIRAYVLLRSSIRELDLCRHLATSSQACSEAKSYRIFAKKQIRHIWPITRHANISNNSNAQSKEFRIISIAGAEKKLAENEKMDRVLSATEDITLIEHNVAMKRYHLSDEHLKPLKCNKRMRSPYHGELPRTLYFERDVMKLARKVHGSPDAVARLLRMNAEFGENREISVDAYLNKQESRDNVGTAKESGTVVGWAISMNLLDATFKYAAWWLSGSHALFAEAIHSTADSFNQFILAIGVRSSHWKPNKMFPYGYGNMRYVTSLISGVGIFFIGCGVSVYHGITGICHPQELEPLTYAYYALATSFIFQASSCGRAFMTLRRRAKAENIPMLTYVRDARDPSLNVVLLEDSAAIGGVLIALGAISLSTITGSPLYDSCGSIMIGTLLGGVASFIIKANSQHLVGRSIPHQTRQQLIDMLRSDPVVRDVHDVKATAIGPDEVRLKAEIDFEGSEITRAYLDDMDLDLELQLLHEIRTQEQLREYLMKHGDGIIDRLGAEVDRVESQIKESHPRIRHIDLEAL